MTDDGNFGDASSSQLGNVFEVVQYLRPGEADPVEFRFDPSSQNIWATQTQISKLFEADVSGVSRHLKNIFESGELERDSNLQKMQVAEASKPITLYSLDAVISVGYRVNSKAATIFRRWATATLRAYIEQGYVLNERALRADPSKLNKLAAEVRALRAEEKQVYAKVRECFKISASDYDTSSSEVRKFYALLQDKFHHAVTGMTSSKLVMDRADHTQKNMGLQSISGKQPTTAEVKVGKNYLHSEELYRLHLLSEQFLLFAESTALAGKTMTMASLHAQLDRLLTLNDYEVFPGYTDFLKQEAVRHAEAELKLYKVKLQVEAKGIHFSEESYRLGDYDDLLDAA
ncbi:MAG: RhuM family protein [Epibacterium sp.]